DEALPIEMIALFSGHQSGCGDSGDADAPSEPSPRPSLRSMRLKVVTMSVRCSKPSSALMRARNLEGDIIVAEFTRELVPDARPNFRWPQSALETPLGDFIVRSTLPHAFAHGGK